MIVLIPAYEPGSTLVDVVRDVQAADPEARVVVVDDGSGPSFAGIFESVVDLGCDLVQGYHICRPTSAQALTDWMTLRDVDLQLSARAQAAVVATKITTT